jgi:hypothetical protein
MRGRGVLIAAGVAAAMLAVAGPAMAEDLWEQSNWFTGQMTASYDMSEYTQVANHDVVVNVSGRGNPALTGDRPGVQSITVTDRGDTVVDGAGCTGLSSHSGTCTADYATEAKYPTATCDPTVWCPPPSGLIESLGVQLGTGDHSTFTDTAGGAPLPISVVTDSGRTAATFSAASSETYRGNDGPDTVTLRRGSGAGDISSAGGDDTIDSRNGVADTIACGDGNDTVHADAADSVAADCETIARG